MLPLGPERGEQPGRGCGGSSPPRRGCRGSRWGRKMAADGRGLCLHLLHHPHPHFGVWTKPGFKKSNSSSPAINRALFPREPAVPRPDQGCPVRPGRQTGTEPAGTQCTGAPWGRETSSPASWGCSFTLAQTYCQPDALVAGCPLTLTRQSLQRACQASKC